ncbi:hypothetical protein [Thorsellia anophelis]|uniref:Uncharacterized protein n=1 Tax=Thorsellia anophelis DSM 18579 TaxID=1123402 RepID=A0A1I0BM11_9GAMM|nr:hypothetical protein [Thorsellia anophelis]SET08040.1 hypothetical protein SAMN02583745_01320 [Thorsellia anophelis DSM 18579]
MKPRKRLSPNSHGVLRNRKRRILLQQRCRSGVFFKISEIKHEKIDWQIVELLT